MKRGYLGEEKWVSTILGTQSAGIRIEMNLLLHNCEEPEVSFFTRCMPVVGSEYRRAMEAVAQ